MRSLKGFTLIELMIVMVIIGILLSLLLPGVFTGRQAAIQTQCASNLRQIAVGMYAYAKDNAGALPATIAALESGTPQYIDTDVVFSCPKTSSAYTFPAAGSNLYSLSSTAMLSTCSDGTDPHAISVYADGHVE